MNDYEYKNENTTEETGFSTDGKKPKKHTGAKIIAYLMAVAIISGGSISAYKALEGRNAKDDDTRAVSAVIDDEEEEDEDDAKDSKIEAETMSLIKTEKASSKALSTEEVVEKMLPTVVGIESTFEITQQTQQFSDSIFGFNFGFGGFGDDYSSPRTSEATATGSGVIVSKDGYIVTNAHVIYDTEYQSGLATEVSVLLSDDSTAEAELVGYDVDLDLAVLKIETDKDLAYAEFGDSDSLKLGESVIAIGNPLGFDLKNTVTSGIISGLSRSIAINEKIMNLIQTDAAINSGNSGGPLINKYGQVIGINSSKMSSSFSGEASIEGLGFAIPSNLVSKVVDELIENGYVAKPKLGITCKDVTASDSEVYGFPEGILVRAVSEGSAAEKAGLKVRDVITAIDGKKVKTFEELSAQLNTHTAGEKIDITFIRDEEEKTVSVTLDASDEKTDDEKKSDKNKIEEPEEEATTQSRSGFRAKERTSEG